MAIEKTALISGISPSLRSETGTPMTGRWLSGARAVWWIVAVLSLSLFIVSLPIGFDYMRTVCAVQFCQGNVTYPAASLLAQTGFTITSFTAIIMVIMIVKTLLFVGIAGYLFWRKPNDRMVWFMSLTLILYGIQSAGSIDGLAALYPIFALPVALLHIAGGEAFSVAIYLFPDGHFRPRWTHWASLAWLIHEFSRAILSHSQANDGPILSLLFIVLLGTIVYAQIWRYRHVSNFLQRRQTRWVVLGILIVAISYMGLTALVTFISPESSHYPLPFLIVDTLFTIAPLAVPVSLLIAFFYARLWDIDFIINRTLVYTALSVCVVGTYVGVVGLLSALFQTSSNLAISLTSTGLIATIVHPLHIRLQRSVNRLFYGERDDPYTVLARLGQRLETTLAPEAILSTIVSTTKEALKLPYVAIALCQNEGFIIASAKGATFSDPIRLALTYQGQPMGQLLLGSRAPSKSFSQVDRRLLDDLARQAGIAIHSVRLTADLQRLTVDLQRSRERLVIAREEERRRLRRDLHDDLAPTLAALALTVSNVADLIPTDPTAAKSLTAELYISMRAAVGDIRRLVYDLRPPTLDELGLIAAIRERAAQYCNYRATTGEPDLPGRIQVFVEAPDQLPVLPAAVEVAAYRIIQEALANAARHAHASHCNIRLSLADVLEIEVTDDGIGLPADHRIGVGLHSMRERADELGGTCRIVRGQPNGTRISVCLPVVKEESDGLAARPDR